MTEEELKNHCERTVLRLTMLLKNGSLTHDEQKRKEEHQLVLDIIEERDELRLRMRGAWFDDE
jgi:hypothetical protein